jgi:hypothetical protein
MFPLKVVNFNEIYIFLCIHFCVMFIPGLFYLLFLCKEFCIVQL